MIDDGYVKILSMKEVDYIIRGEFVVTMDSALTILKDGAIAVKDGIIIDTGQYEELSKIYSAGTILVDQTALSCQD